jgi:hypothetical protein
MERKGESGHRRRTIKRHAEVVDAGQSKIDIVRANNRRISVRPLKYRT